MRLLRRGIDRVTIDASDLEDHDRVQLVIRSGRHEVSYELTHERDARAIAELELQALSARTLLDPHTRLDRIEGETDPEESRSQESAVGRRAVMLLGLLLEEGPHIWEYMEPEVMQVLGTAGALGVYDLGLPISAQFGDYLADRVLGRKLEDLGRLEPDPEDVRDA